MAEGGAKTAPKGDHSKNKHRGDGMNLDVKLSKSLAWLLRHNAEKCGFKLMPGGFLYVNEVLQHPRFKGSTEDDVLRVVSTCEKQRFLTEREGGHGRLKIRATRGQSFHRGEGMNRDIQLSKSLSWLLRHAAEKCGFKLMPGGFLYVDEVLQHQRFKGATEGDVLRVVLTNEKQRFATEREGGHGRLKIRANQGHSVYVDDLGLVPIVDPDDAPIVVHGTYLRVWPLIQTQGLKRMTRTHIHFAPDVPGTSEVISGIRSSCEVLVFIDFKKALEANLKFFRSANNVILSAGDQNGCILPYLFDKVIQIRPKRQQLSFDASIGVDTTQGRGPTDHLVNEHPIVTVIDSMDKQELLPRHTSLDTVKEALGVACLFSTSDDDSTTVQGTSVRLLALALRNQCFICDLVTCPGLLSDESSYLRELLESKDFIKVYNGPSQMGRLFNEYQVLVSFTPLCDIKSAYATWLTEKEGTVLSPDASESLTIPSIASKLRVTYDPGSLVTDWTTRPLTSEMIDYAASEVNALLRLHNVFSESRVNMSAVTRHTFESLNHIIVTDLARQLYKQRKKRKEAKPD